MWREDMDQEESDKSEAVVGVDGMRLSLNYGHQRAYCSPPDDI
jgi:hypothetical protein